MLFVLIVCCQSHNCLQKPSISYRCYNIFPVVPVAETVYFELKLQVIQRESCQ